MREWAGRVEGVVKLLCNNTLFPLSSSSSGETHANYPHTHVCKWYINYSYRLCIARCTHTHQTALSFCMTHASRDHTRKDNTIALGIGYKHYPILLQRVTISLVSFNSSFYLTNRCVTGALYHLKEDRAATP